MIVVFADGYVGFKCLDWLINNFKRDISIVFTQSKNDIYNKCKCEGLRVEEFTSEESYLKLIKENKGKITLGLLIWWPKIINEKVIKSIENGFINTHPSYLPFNRGKHYNFWALVEQCPFGVTLHKVEVGIDTGPIIAQKKIDYSWEDTGESLYKKAVESMIELFKNNYPEIRLLNFKYIKQDLSKGSFHYANEIEKASKINLNEITTARKLLNLIRARTFQGFPACFFEENDVVYEVRIRINKKS